MFKKRSRISNDFRLAGRENRCVFRGPMIRVPTVFGKECLLCVAKTRRLMPAPAEAAFEC